ncbi:MAG: acyl dehydratase [Gemmatimonadetes bacterium]|nr:acyl dehydratase [Gemmatimonadota bacterium]
MEEGMEIPPLTKRPTNLQLFRFSAVTWNAHRIHYDAAYAREEGYPDVLVQAHLHGAFLIQMLQSWIGPRGRLLRFGWQNRALAVPGDVLTCTGRVTKKYDQGQWGYLECVVQERNQRGELCAPGTALVALPLSDPAAERRS